MTTFVGNYTCAEIIPFRKVLPAVELRAEHLLGLVRTATKAWKRIFYKLNAKAQRRQVEFFAPSRLCVQ